MADPDRPSDAMEKRLMSVMAEILGVPRVSVDDNFFALGGHSLLAVRFCSRLEHDLGVRLPMLTLFEHPTVASLATLLRHVEAPARTPVLVPLQPRGDRPPLFCVHGLSGSVATDLARFVPADQPLYGLQPAGVDEKEAPLDTIPAMAERYLTAIREVQPHGPYYLGGYCMGGSIALEMTHRLLADGEEVALLVAICTDLRGNLPASGLWNRCRRFLSERLRLRSGTGGRPRAEDGAAQSFPADWAEEYRRIAPHNLRAALGYTPMPCAVRAVLIRPEAPALPFGLGDDTWGWSEVALAGVDVVRIPTRDTEILVEPHVRVVAPLLVRCLQNGKGGPGSGLARQSSEPAA